MPQARSHLDADDSTWETHKDLLRDLWLKQNLKLDGIMKFMSDFHNFRAQ